MKVQSIEKHEQHPVQMEGATGAKMRMLIGRLEAPAIQNKISSLIPACRDCSVMLLPMPNMAGVACPQCSRGHELNSRKITHR